MAYTIVTGTPGIVDPSGSYVDSGWVIAEPYATHFPCNPGYMKYGHDLGLIVGRAYVVQYTVDNYISGGVNIKLGTASGVNRTANGIYTETITCTANTDVQFYSDGSLRISALTVYDQVIGQLPGYTIAFYDGDQKRWGLKYSFVPEYQVRFKNNLYQFQNGQVWLHASNEVRCNFFGVQYNSSITIAANIEPTMMKIFYSIRVQSNRVWAAIATGDITIPATEGKTDGMQSRLMANRFKMLQGNYFADFLRNMLSPGFDTELKALFNGAELRGEYMEITLTNTDTIEVRLVEIAILTSKSMYTY